MKTKTSPSSQKTGDKVACAVCGETGHVLVKHIAEKHKLSPVEYVEKYPDAPLFSAIGATVLREKCGHDGFEARESETITVKDLLGWKKENYAVKKQKGYSENVPVGTDQGYVYPYDATMAVLYAIHRSRRKSIWISGPSGTGKTQLVINLTRLLNRELFRFNGHLNATPNDPIGDWVFDGKAQKFIYGPLPLAMKQGGIFLLDEVDLLNPVVMPIFRTVLEDTSTLRIPETGETIIAHPDFVFVATANTWGGGDTTGLYGQTGNFSLADRQRFALFIELGYLEKETELEVLKRNVPDLEEDEAVKLVQVGNSIREGFKEGKLEEPISPRQLINWGEVLVETGSAITSALMTFLLPLGEATRVAVKQLITEAGFTEEE